jgi:hypothetical protein
VCFWILKIAALWQYISQRQLDKLYQKSFGEMNYPFGTQYVKELRYRNISTQNPTQLNAKANTRSTYAAVSQRGLWQVTMQHDLSSRPTVAPIPWPHKSLFLQVFESRNLMHNYESSFVSCPPVQAFLKT